MSRAEARRRLQKADPNLTIIHGRRYPYAMRGEQVPKLLSAEEARWWGLGEMFPIIPPQFILDIEAKWSKLQLQGMCWTYGIDPRSADKAALIRLLLWAGVLDEDGNFTGKEPRKRGGEEE